MRAPIWFGWSLPLCFGLFVSLGALVGCASQSMDRPESFDHPDAARLATLLRAPALQDTGTIDGVGETAEGAELEGTVNDGTGAMEGPGGEIEVDGAGETNAEGRIRGRMDERRGEIPDITAAEARPDEGDWTAGGGVGFTADPVAFLMVFEGGYELVEELSVGPHIQLALDDDGLLLAPTLHVEKSFTLPEDLVGPRFDQLRPNVQGGLGLVYIDPDTVDGEVGFLLNFGFGADYWVTQNVGVSSNMLFNIIPDDVFTENFFWSWEVLGVRFRF